MPAPDRCWPWRSPSVLGWELVILLSVSNSWANGRFPRSERLIEHPTNSTALVLAATYGLLVTADRGQNWSYVCEKSFALQDNYVGDPLVTWAADGTLLVGVQSSLNRSRDQACSWSVALGGAGQMVVDYALSGSDRRTILALVSSYRDGGLEHGLRESTDGGTTWQTVGDPLPIAVGYTLDVDPTDPNQVFATGVTNDRRGVFLVSATHGVGWQSYDVPGTSADEPPYIALVDPQDPRKIYLRTDAWPETDGNLVGNDALLYSDDGGQTWQERFRVQAKMLGFARSPAADTILLGYGDPKLDPYLVDDAVMGIYASTAGISAFTQVYAGLVTCLTWNDDGIYACTSQAERGFALGFAPSLAAIAGGAGLMPLLDLHQVRGPLGCCGGSTTLVCGAVWSTACGIFGTCSDAGPPAPVCTSEGGGADGLGGRTGAGEPSDSAVGAQEETGAAARSPTESSCGCRVPRPAGRGTAALGLAVLTWFRARRRRQAPKHRPARRRKLGHSGTS